jgi:hypothetical protein
LSGRIHVEKEGALGWLVFDHPERRNAISHEMWQVLPDAARSLDADPDVRVVLLRGAGEVAFVSGADISEFEGRRTGGAAAAAGDHARFGRSQVSQASARDDPASAWAAGSPPRSRQTSATPRTRPVRDPRGSARLATARGIGRSRVVEPSATKVVLFTRPAPPRPSPRS